MVFSAHWVSTVCLRGWELVHLPAAKRRRVVVGSWAVFWEADQPMALNRQALSRKSGNNNKSDLGLLEI